MVFKICVSLLNEEYFSCLLTIYVHSFEHCLFISALYFLGECVVFIGL